MGQVMFLLLQRVASHLRSLSACLGRGGCDWKWLRTGNCARSPAPTVGAMAARRRHEICSGRNKFMSLSRVTDCVRDGAGRADRSVNIVTIPFWFHETPHFIEHSGTGSDWKLVRARNCARSFASTFGVTAERRRREICSGRNKKLSIFTNGNRHKLCSGRNMFYVAFALPRNLTHF